MLKRVEGKPQSRWLTHADECDLAFRWQYERDRRALATLVLAFNALVHSMAAERFRVAQLDKGVKVIDLEKTRGADALRLVSAELAGHFAELVQAGFLGLLEAANRFDGRNRFATYARQWVFKRMQEYVRSNWHVVLLPEPAEWKVAKEDQIPPTLPNPQLNPFENPLSPDKTAKRSREARLASPFEREDNVEENVVGRFGPKTIDYAASVVGADHFEPSECQSRAHESIEALHRAIELECLAAELDARTVALVRREYQIIRTRFPWAIDVKNAPHREDENGFPRKHNRSVIGVALGISDERVRQIEQQALDALGSRAMPEHWVYRLLDLIPACFDGPKKRRLSPRILFEEEIAKPVPMSSKVVGQISRSKKAASAPNYCVQVGWDLARFRIGEARFQYLLTSGYIGNCPRR